MASDDVFSNKDELHAMLHTLFSSGDDSDHELTAAHAPEPNPNKRPLTDDNFDWDHWTKVVNSEPPIPAPAKRPKYENQVEDVQQPNPALEHASSAASQVPYYPLMDVLGPSSTAATQGP